MAKNPTKTWRMRRSSKREEKRKPRTRFSTSTMDSLPTDIIIEVIAQVAASSAVDLFSCKLSCKALHEIGQEKQILQKVSLENLPYYTWIKTDETKLFFQRCQECNNPEALFQIGMVQYFSKLMLNEGIKNLEKAAEQGHKGATYALGLILLCVGENSELRRGIKLIMDMLKVLNGREIVECRKKLCNTMKTIWMNNYLILLSRPSFTCAMQQQHAIWRGWGENDYFDEDCVEKVVCETCRCSREIDFFYKLLPVIN